MALIERFEDILAWQEARKLVGEIYKLTNSGALAKDYGLKDQLQLYVAFDVGYIDKKTFDTEYEQARKTKALIGGFKNSLKKRNP